MLQYVLGSNFTSGAQLAVANKQFLDQTTVPNEIKTDKIHILLLYLETQWLVVCDMNRIATFCDDHF